MNRPAGWGRVQPMWREFQLLPFTGMALGISVTLTVTMIVFTYLLFLNLFAQSFTRSLLVVLLVLGVVSLTLLLLTVTQLLYVTVTARRDALTATQVLEWRARLQAFLAGAPAPAELDALGVRALLRLREEVGDADGARLAALYDTLGLRAHDERVAARGRGSSERSLALERLVTVQDPRSLPVFLALLGETSTSLRLLALLGVTRLARGGQAVPPALLPALTSGRFSTQQVREALCLIGPAAEPLVRTLAADPRDPWRELAVDTAGRIDPARHADLVPGLLRDASPGVRAGALRLYAGAHPDSAPLRREVWQLSRDAAWPVRAMSAQAMGTFPRPPVRTLWRLLGDPNWWVRHHAARSLQRSLAGRAALGAAAQSHPDRFARDMARATLPQNEPAA